MYDPVIGRWTTQDPAMQFTNPYIFCGNNPVQYIDPDGEWILGALLGGIFNLTMDPAFEEILTRTPNGTNGQLHSVSVPLRVCWVSMQVQVWRALVQADS